MPCQISRPPGRFPVAHRLPRLPVSRPAPLPKLAVHVSPVGGDGAHQPRSRIGALVLAADPAARTAVDPQRLAAALGLTPAESRIAVLLARAGGSTTSRPRPAAAGPP